MGHTTGHISEVVLERADVLRELPFAAVLSIDSEPRVAEMPWARERRERDSGWALQLDPLVVSGESLVEIASAGILTGFDEIWVTEALPVPQVPDGVRIVATFDLEAPAPADLLSWALSARARVGLGDGVALNYFIADRALGRRLGLVT